MVKKIVRKLYRKFFRPAVLKKLNAKSNVPPRKKAQNLINDQPLVYQITNVKSAEKVFDRINKIWDEVFARFLLPEHRILLKVNLNTADAYPASSSPEMVAALVDFLRSKGCKKLIIGDCTSNVTLPTRRVAAKTGLLKALKNKADFAFFDEGNWVEVNINGEYLEKVTVPELAMQVDRIISFANLKTHCLADFTFGMKLAVGFMHPLERKAMHREFLKEKTVEINLAVPADLTIIDGRTAFITGGPSAGKTSAGEVVFIGTDQLAVDFEAYKYLYRLKQESGCLECFTADPFKMSQLKHARKIELGGQPWKGSKLLEI